MIEIEKKYYWIISISSCAWWQLLNQAEFYWFDKYNVNIKEYAVKIKNLTYELSDCFYDEVLSAIEIW